MVNTKTPLFGPGGVTYSRMLVFNLQAFEDTLNYLLGFYLFFVLGTKLKDLLYKYSTGELNPQPFKSVFSPFLINIDSFSYNVI